MLLKSNKRTMPDDKPLKELDEELIEFRKHANTIKTLEAQISVLTQERDSALAMWATTEKELQKFKHELESPRSNEKLQHLLQEMQHMQRDYSDAIHLLEGKLLKNQEEATNLLIINEKLKKDLELAEQQKNRLAEEVNRLEEEINKISRDKGELSSALERCLARVEEAVQIEQQARSKVSDALDLAQQALSQQDVASEEKEKLQKQIKQFTQSTNIKYNEEINKAMGQVQELTRLLESSEKEKQELSDEFEQVKVDCFNKLQEIIVKNKALSTQCRDIHQKGFTERLQWSEERKMLRTQIMTLQSCIEQVNVNLREQKLQFPCRKCAEIKKKASNYKKIASRWRKVSHEFQERLERREKNTRFKPKH